MGRRDRTWQWSTHGGKISKERESIARKAGYGLDGKSSFPSSSLFFLKIYFLCDARLDFVFIVHRDRTLLVHSQLEEIENYFANISRTRHDALSKVWIFYLYNLCVFVCTFTLFCYTSLIYIYIYSLIYIYIY